MTLYSTRVGKRKSVNQKAGVCRKRIVWPLMQEYATGLKALKGLNIKIDTTGCMQAIATSSAIERLANIGWYDW